jgi:hypothetical protein
MNIDEIEKEVASMIDEEIETREPRAFLLSGGGNYVSSEELLSYLNQKALGFAEAELVADRWNFGDSIITQTNTNTIR